MDTCAVVAGWGGCLPPGSVSNDDLATRLDTSHEWIHRRTGISARHWADARTSTSDLAVGAGLAALESSGSHAADLVLLATTTPDRRCPATAPDVAWRLGLGNVPALDIGAVCSGFVYGLALAGALIRSQPPQRVLLIAAETYSRIVNPDDRNTAVIFGDGAGAVLLRGGSPDEPGALHGVHLGSDGSGGDLITVEAGGARMPVSDHGVSAEEKYFRMNGKKVFGLAVRHMVDSSREVLLRSRWDASSVEAFVGHQANQRILDAVAERMGIDPGKCFGNIGRVGNTAAASIPLALADVSARGVVRPGARTLLAAFGGGLTWGAATLSWPTATAVHREPVHREPVHREPVLAGRPFASRPPRQQEEGTDGPGLRIPRPHADGEVRGRA
ncbi:beta-ketoacyl-ACP synthase III [Streptomyces sp. NPDC003035]|uniref:beta-ketoacyl-ACP synthase III n=1 Tax=Streptomyces sp. NPDC003035 TaxID=3364676 RepID=UPI0036985C61